MNQQQEFVNLINEHQGIIYKICQLYGAHTMDKDDLFQEIVIQLWKGYPKFRGDSKFSTWMYRIALNTAITDFRKSKRQVKTTDIDGLQLESAYRQYDPAEEEKLALLKEAIRSLPEIERAIVMLYLEDRSYEEMEEILGINQNNLRVKMSRIKEKLRKLTKAASYGVG